MPLLFGRLSSGGYRCAVHGRLKVVCARCVLACLGWWLGSLPVKKVSVIVHLGKEGGEVGGLGVV